MTRFFSAYLLTIRIDFDSKHPATKGTNVLYHAFPPPQPVSLETALAKLKLIQYGIAGSVFFIWLTVSFGSGLVAFVYRSTLCSVTAFILMTALSLVERSLEKDVEKVRQDMGRQRGEAFSPPVPESVEWLNGLIKLVWGLVDPYANSHSLLCAEKKVLTFWAAQCSSRSPIWWKTFSSNPSPAL